MYALIVCGTPFHLVGIWFYCEHSYCTDSVILFLFLLTNVLIVSCFG